MILVLEGVAEEDSKYHPIHMLANKIINANSTHGKDLTLSAGYSKALNLAVTAAGEAATSDI